MRAWVTYSILRVLAFAIPFVVLYLLLPDYWWVAVLGATVIGFCVSYIFLRPQRDRIAQQLAQSRAREPQKRADESAEDAD